MLNVKEHGTQDAILAQLASELRELVSRTEREAASLLAGCQKQLDLLVETQKVMTPANDYLFRDADAVVVETFDVSAHTDQIELGVRQRGAQFMRDAVIAVDVPGVVHHSAPPTNPIKPGRYRLLAVLHRLPDAET